MTEIAGAAKVHEAYAFACMRCGYGWEQSYQIEHHLDAHGREYVVYRAEGERVPSPLSSPTCVSCGGHVVRIMRAGQVSSVLDRMARPGAAPPGAGGLRETGPAPIAGPIGAEALAGEGQTPVDGAPAREDAASRPQHHWRLSDLLHPFQRR
ncbi:hypothetical protein [Streptomyces yaizuensis]|uniref:C2H2-type domain-containing protein n=1 Tax=Streptomyces yaizuensis TaxID=2989713 RepID=A0ABQ5PA27_9ACTN|nr:hypothetical protein [Streptomyces sp. YSPA8]GLF99401.1 hypothetical protein SYYSPA8_33910 [Streptomyces sp. YSPA8]